MVCHYTLSLAYLLTLLPVKPHIGLYFDKRKVRGKDDKRVQERQRGGY
jgi:hypothetical protein